MTEAPSPIRIYKRAMASFTFSVRNGQARPGENVVGTLKLSFLGWFSSFLRSVKC